MRAFAVRDRKGFTLVEALMAVTVGLVFLGTVITLLTFTTKNWKERSVKSQIRFDVQGSLQKLKEDARLTDGGKILFYPSGATEYTAISIPQATADDNGLLEIDDDQIVWDTTVIYHAYEGELRRTVIDSFSANNATRQAELDEVAASGESDDGETETLFEAGDVTFTITPEDASFDGYAASEELSQNTSFGTARLASGTHTIQFKVTGKASASSGYRMGIDRISLAPSGSPREAEDLTISASSGDTTAEEDMSSYEAALWSGNYQVEYRSNAVNDSITFTVDYDAWAESNFEEMTQSETEVRGTNPIVGLAARETQGLTPGWRASTQTGVTSEDYTTDAPDTAVRNVISGSVISRAGDLVRVKFMASSAGTLNITEAYFGVSSGGTQNFSGTPIRLYFDNDPVDSGDADPVGEVGAGSATSVTLSAGQYVWSNWFAPAAAVTSPSATSYLVSYKTGAAGSTYPSYWDAGTGTHSYALVSGSTTADWTGADLYTSSSAIFAVDQLAVWSATGTATSQVYDTTLTAPAYDKMYWTTNAVGTVTMKARSSASPLMTGATDWSAIGGGTTSPANLSIGNGRYVQFQATFVGVTPFLQYPELDAVKITWPGQTALVEISGYYTKRPNYGMFEVIVDGQSITNALTVRLEAEKEYQGRTQSYTSSAVIDCKNTGL